MWSVSHEHGDTAMRPLRSLPAQLRKSSCRAIGFTAAVALGVAAPVVLPSAAMATPLGEPGGGYRQPGFYVVVQGGTPAGAPSYRVPGPGVITNWQTESRGDEEAALTLVSQESDANGGSGPAFRVVGRSQFEPSGAGVQSYPTSLRVSGGEMLGITTDSGEQAHPGDGVACGLIANGFLDHPSVGETRVASCSDGLRVNVSATYEPDVDGDGFGDESQDQCVGSAGLVAGCQPARPGASYAGQTSGNQRILLVATANGGAIRRVRFRMRARCTGGLKRTIQADALSSNDTEMVHQDGTFRILLVISRDRVLRTGQVTVVGKFSGSSAQGSIRLRARARGAKTCSGRVTWKARS